RMMDGLSCDYQFRVEEVVLAGIVISIVIREIATGDFQPDPMSRKEGMGRWTQFYFQLGDFSGYEEFLPVQRPSVPRFYHTIADLQRWSLRCLVDQAPEEISVGC